MVLSLASDFMLRCCIRVYISNIVPTHRVQWYLMAHMRGLDPGKQQIQGWGTHVLVGDLHEDLGRLPAEAHEPAADVAQEGRRGAGI